MVLVRHRDVSSGQEIHSPGIWNVTESLSLNFHGGERLRWEGRPDLTGVALRWVYCRPSEREAV